jgi:hypothetical protein
MKPCRPVAPVLATIWLLIATIPPAWSDNASQPLALRKIMQDLGSQMQTITDGIAREDWGLVENTTPLIADHPRPPLLEKTRILRFVGSDMGRYKRHDDATHAAAKGLGQAARSQDGPAVIAAFQALQMSCYDCHREFRKPFVEHFYGMR